MKPHFGKFRWPLFLMAVILLPAFALAQTESDSSRKATKVRTKADSIRRALRMNSMLFSIDSLVVRLALTPEQEPKINAILKTDIEQADADRELYKGFPQALNRATKERFDKTDKEILTLLNADQKKKYELLKKEHFARMQERQKQRTTEKAKPASTP